MKRTILFRGKRTDNGEWVEGFYGYKLESDKHFIMYEEINSNCPSYFMDIEVYPDTVGQFTGLTDKNGKMIFEGDILSCNRINYQLKLETAKAYELHQIGIDTTNGDGFFFLFNHNQKVEVIGNIHDNYK